MLRTADRTEVRGRRVDSWFSWPESLNPPTFWTEHHTRWTFGPLTIERIHDPAHYLDARQEIPVAAETTWKIRLEWKH